MLARAEALLKESNQLMADINPNCDDYKAIDAFYTATRKLIIDLTGDPDYFEHRGSGLEGLGSSREQH